jgi:predicted O-linked N-acetylglucosamine transferase (SPINDLY family)
VEFNFFLAVRGQLSYFELTRVVRDRVPRAIVYPYSLYKDYMERLARCDLFLSPFPHGGMTTIMDMFQLGLPGVCLDGVEPHAHADAAMFSRISLPAELTTKSVDEYVAAAIRMIDDTVWRHQCAEIVRNADLDKAFYKGDPSLFCKAIENLIWPSENP